MKENHSEGVDENIAAELLMRTWLDTNSLIVRKLENLSELQAALVDSLPGGPTFTFLQLSDYYDRVILLIIKKIITTTNLSARRITREDILNCRVSSYALENDFPDLDLIPGLTLLD